MAAQFDWMAKVPQMHKDCIIGYVKEAQSILPVTSAYYNIPSLVTYLILKYYHQQEIFDIHGDDITLDTMQLTASINVPAIMGTTNSVFGLTKFGIDKLAHFAADPTIFPKPYDGSSIWIWICWI